MVCFLFFSSLRSQILSFILSKEITFLSEIDGFKSSNHKKLFYMKANIAEFIVDETQIKIGSELIWLCGVVFKPKDKQFFQ
jgi:hypothetical protein